MPNRSVARFPHLTTPAPGETHRGRSGIHWLRMPLPSPSTTSTSGCSEDEHDGQPALDHRRYRLRTGRRARPVGDRVLGRLTAPVTAIIVTHFHPDHIGLAQWLQETTGAPVWMTAAEYLTAHAVFHESSGHGIDADAAPVWPPWAGRRAPRRSCGEQLRGTVPALPAPISASSAATASDQRRALQVP